MSTDDHDSWNLSEGSVCGHTRRALVLGLLAGAVPGTQAAARDPRRALPQKGDVLVTVAENGTAAPLKVSALVENAAPVLVWPAEGAGEVVRDRSRLNRLLVLKLDPTTLDPTAKRLAKDGVVVYSGVCSHATCPVSEWNAESRRLVCPCHGSQYDAAAHARVVAGPAPRALPMLAVEVVDDTLRVLRPFAGKPGARSG